MKITTEHLPQHLKRGVAPLYTVFGAEPLLALEAADLIRARMRAEGYDERTVLTVDQHFDWSQLKTSGQSLSLFASRRILEVRIPNGKPGVEGGAALQDYCHALPADTITLVQLPEVEWRAQKGGWFGALEDAGVLVEAKKVGRGVLPAWIAGRLAAYGQRADEQSLAFIADKVEGNLLAAHQEVQKLGLLLPAGKIAFDDVRSAVQIGRAHV